MSWSRLSLGEPLNFVHWLSLHLVGYHRVPLELLYLWSCVVVCNALLVSVTRDIHNVANRNFII